MQRSRFHCSFGFWSQLERCSSHSLDEDSHSRTVELQTSGAWISVATSARSYSSCSLRFGIQPKVALEHSGTGPEGSSRRNRSTGSTKSTHHPTTAVQYTSGTAKIRSSLRLNFDPGREKTVSAFAITSACDVFGVFWPVNTVFSRLVSIVRQVDVKGAQSHSLSVSQDPSWTERP